MSSADSAVIRILVDLPVYLHRYPASIFYALGNLGNIITLCILLTKPWRKNVCVFYFLVCLIADTIFLNVTVLGAIFTVGFQISLENSSVLWCKLFFYISYALSVYLPLVLILASIDRLLISSQNVDTRLYSSKRLAYLLISVSGAVCVLYSLHVLIKVNIQELYPSFFVCYFDQSPFYREFFTYTTAIQGVLLPTILIVLSIFAFKNVRRIRAVPRRQRREIRLMNKKDFQLLRCLYVHNVLYVGSSVFLGFVVVYSAVTRTGTETPLQMSMLNCLNSIGSFLHYIPYGASFCIFASTSKAFRMELKKLTGKLYQQNPTAAPEEDNQLHEVVRTLELKA